MSGLPDPRPRSPAPGTGRQPAWLTAQACWLAILPMVLLSMATGCRAAPTQAPAAQEDGHTVEKSRVETGPSDPDGSNAPQWAVNNKLARLQGGFSLADDGRTLQVRYTVTGIGDYPLLVFDRGDALSVATGRQSAGGVGAPQVQVDGGDLTLSHVAQPLSNPAPTAPPSPLVSQVLPGDEYRNRFSYTLPGRNGQVRRVRYCQGVIGVPEPLPESDRLQGGVWRVPNAFAGHQGTLCSPWYDLAMGVLAD